MTDLLHIGRLLSAAGSGSLAIICLLSIPLTKAPTILWVEAMLALSFSFSCFTSCVALSIGGALSPQFSYFVVLNGAVHLSIAIIAAGVLWGYKKRAKLRRSP